MNDMNTNTLKYRLVGLAAVLLLFTNAAAALSVDSVTVDPDHPAPFETVNVKVSGSDNGKIMNAQLYWGGEWHTKSCGTFLECDKTFSFKPTQDKEYTVKARVQDDEFSFSDTVSKSFTVSSHDNQKPEITSLDLPENPDPWDRVSIRVTATDDKRVDGTQIYWNGNWYSQSCSSSSCENVVKFTPTQDKVYTVKARAWDSDDEYSDTVEKDLKVGTGGAPDVTDFTVSDSNPDRGEYFDVDVNAEAGKKLLNVQAYWNGEWHTKSCGSATCDRSFTFLAGSPGTYNLKVRAQDTSFDFSDVREKEINVGQTDRSPSVSLNYPLNEKVGTTPTLRWDSNDPDDTVSNKLYIDDDSTPFVGPIYTEKVGQDESYTVPSGVLEHGERYSWGVKTSAGGETVEDSSYFTVRGQQQNDHPRVRWIDVENSPRAGEPVKISARATDDSRLLNIQFRVDGEKYTKSCGSSTCEKSIEFTPGSSGDYTVDVRAQDTSFLLSDWSSKDFHVSSESGSCDYHAGGLNLDDDTIEKGSSTRARVKVNNYGDDQKFRVRFRVAGSTVSDSTRTIDGGSSRTFSTTVSPSDDALVSAVVTTEGDPCGYEKNVRSQELLITSGNGGNNDHAPTADFTVSDYTPNTGKTVRFDSTSTDPDGDIVSYSWRFGDGSTASGSSVQHSYSSTGTYTARLTVKDSNGNTDTESRQITVGTERGDCGVSLGSRLELSRQTITRGDSSEASVKVYNAGDPQEVKVEFREGTRTVKTFRKTISGDRYFRADVSPGEDTLINARITTVGDPCGSDEWVRSREIFVVGQERASLDVHVENRQGGNLENALVSVDGGKLRETSSDGDVSYRLDPGTYDIEVQKDGYVSRTRTVSLDPGDRRTMNFALRGGTTDRDIEISNVGHSSTVCRGGTLPVDVKVRNNGNSEDVVSVSANGLGDKIKTASRTVKSGESRTWTVRFTNVQGSGTEEFRITATNSDTHTVRKKVQVRDCNIPVGGKATDVSMELQPRKAVSGKAVKVRGFVDGTAGRSEVTVKVDGSKKAEVGTQPDGYFETYIRVNEVGKHTVSASTDSVTDTDTLEIFPTASVSFVDTPRKVFEGEKFKLCADVNSQIKPKLVLFEDGKIVRTKNEKGDVCFSLKSTPGEHEYRLRALTYGEGGEATASVNVLKSDVEASSFPSQIATVESGSGIVKVELYNTHDSLRRYDLALEGLPEKWVSQSEKQVVLAKGERKTVYFYLTPQEKGSYSPTVSISSDGSEIYRDELPVVTGGTTKPQRKSLLQLLRDLVFY